MSELLVREPVGACRFADFDGLERLLYGRYFLHHAELPGKNARLTVFLPAAHLRETWSDAMHLTWKNWAVFVVLSLLGAPWYWGLLWPGDRSLLFGMPTWAATAIFASFFTSCYTAWLLRTPWDAEGNDSEPGGEQ